MRIDSINQLRDVLRYEKPLYPNHLYDWLALSQRVYNWRFIKALRWAEFFRFKEKNSHGALRVAWLICYLLATRKKNRIGSRIGVEIDVGTFDRGLIVHHNGSIVVSSNASIGRDCQLHGDNCIGNTGGPVDSGSPIIGDNVDIGVGAKVLGNIRIADNVRIGANAVVVDSFDQPGVVIAGVPARKIKMRDDI